MKDFEQKPLNIEDFTILNKPTNLDNLNMLPFDLSRNIARDLNKGREEAERALESIYESKREKDRRDEEKHQELLTEIKKTNEILSDRLSSANETLDFILNSLGANFQRVEQQQILSNQLFHELREIIQERDKHKLKRFIEDHAVDGLAVLLQFLSLILAPKV